MKRILTLIAIGIIIGGVLYFFKNKSVEITGSRLIGSWKLESYNGNKDILASITFQKDGEYTAKICNDIKDSYEINNGNLKFNGKITQTIMACQGSAGAAEDGFHRLVSDMQKKQSETKIEHGKLKLQTQTDIFIFTKKFF